jgi:hypothetical protein
MIDAVYNRYGAMSHSRVCDSWHASHDNSQQRQDAESRGCVKIILSDLVMLSNE